MIPQVEYKDYAIQEYLEFEVNSPERHEYINGKIILRSGNIPNHNQIADNFATDLNFAVKRQFYQVFIVDQRLWIPKKCIYAYPHVMLVQGGLEFQEGRRDTITNPLVIAEVLSESTRSYNKDDKFAVYQTISTFKEYILIDQYEVHVEQDFKTDDKRWTFTEYDDLNETLSLNSMPFEIALADISDKIQFE
ncbi:hypothetical protein NIES2101_08435 [Calothrix sp. HK-06]|nr:hypothetical protein NIES2101_08435 [Calothrix sp. HK-06]